MDFPLDDPNFQGKTDPPRILHDKDGNYRFRFNHHPRKGGTKVIDCTGYQNQSLAALEADMYRFMLYHNSTISCKRDTVNWIPIGKRQFNDNSTQWEHFVNLYSEYRKAQMEDNGKRKNRGLERSNSEAIPNSLTVLKSRDLFSYKRAKAFGEVSTIVEWNMRKLSGGGHRREKVRNRKDSQANKKLSYFIRKIPILMVRMTENKQRLRDHSRNGSTYLLLFDQNGDPCVGEDSVELVSIAESWKSNIIRAFFT